MTSALEIPSDFHSRWPRNFWVESLKRNWNRAVRIWPSTRRTRKSIWRESLSGGWNEACRSRLSHSCEASTKLSIHVSFLFLTHVNSSSWLRELLKLTSAIGDRTRNIAAAITTRTKSSSGTGTSSNDSPTSNDWDYCNLWRERARFRSMGLRIFVVQRGRVASASKSGENRIHCHGLTRVLTGKENWGILNFPS